jgi:hypothetical protein
MAQVVEHLPSKAQGPEFKPHYLKKKKKAKTTTKIWLLENLQFYLWLALYCDWDF